MISVRLRLARLGSEILCSEFTLQILVIRVPYGLANMSEQIGALVVKYC